MAIKHNLYTSSYDFICRLSNRLISERLLTKLADLDHLTTGDIEYCGKRWIDYRANEKQHIKANEIGFIYQFHY